MAFVRNLWYVAAFSEEIGDAFFARAICDIPILLYRKDAGDVVALHDRCPHRFAPLSLGRRTGDRVRCGYHGLVFDEGGVCVLNPHGSSRAARHGRTRSFPVHESFGLIWLWFGDEDKRDEDLIPDFSCLTDYEQYATVSGYLRVEAHYELITDNLLDLSHVEYLHEGLLGSEAISRGEHKVRQTGGTVHSDRWCPDGLAPPAWDAMFGSYGRPVDHWLNMRWDAPAHMLLDVGVTPTGRERGAGIFIYGTDIITPETETTSHYFWAISRSHDLDDETVGKRWAASVEIAFGQQDKPMLEAVQAQMGNARFDDLRPMIVESDRGAIRCRNVIKTLLKQEKFFDCEV